MNCSKCNMQSFNGVPYHETGCPNILRYLKTDIPESFMKEVAHLTGLSREDSDDTASLHAETIFTYSAEMTGKEYCAMEKDINNYSLEGKGFIVYAWNDGSGYYYWTVKQEEDNYIQITVQIKGKSIDVAEIKKLVAKAQKHFSVYARK